MIFIFYEFLQMFLFLQKSLSSLTSTPVFFWFYSVFFLLFWIIDTIICLLDPIMHYLGPKIEKSGQWLHWIYESWIWFCISNSSQFEQFCHLSHHTLFYNWSETWIRTKHISISLVSLKSTYMITTLYFFKKPSIFF